MALDPISSALNLGETIISRIWPDKEASERRELEAFLKQIEQAHGAAMAQAEINKVEAGHRTVFVAGWRPAIGWCCALALVYGSIGYPLAASLGVGAELPPPTFIEDNIMELLFAMLGMGGLRSFEKVRGVAR